MANASAAATQWNLPNYVGELIIANPRTTFLNDVGGYNWGLSTGFEFPCGNVIDLESAAQPAITETASLTAPTATTYVPTQEYNVCQIHQKAVSISYARLSDNAKLSGITVAGVPVNQDPRAVQITSTLRQIATDVDYTFINGAFQAATNSGVAWKTRGLITACTTNTLDVSGAELTEAHINSLLEEMAGNGAEFIDMGIYVNAWNLNKITEIYKVPPMDRYTGGNAIQRIVTPFCELAVRFAPNVPAATVLVADRSKCRPVALPVPGKGVLFYEELSKTGAGETGQVYGQIGIDYTAQRYHGTITTTATADVPAG